MVNPKVGRRVQHLATFEVEKTVAVVRNHEGGTWWLLAAGTRRRGDGDIDKPGVDTLGQNDGGAIFDNPKRGSLNRKEQAAWTGTRRERRRERSRGCEVAHLPMCGRPEQVALEGTYVQRESKAAYNTRKGSGKPTSHDTPRVTPPHEQLRPLRASAARR